MLGLGIIAGGVLFCLIARKTRRKRPLASRHKRLIIDSELEPSMLHFSSPSPVSSTTYHAHELQATAAGDSTLKVRIIYFNIQCCNLLLCIISLRLTFLLI